jgi:hypothetical protein
MLARAHVRLSELSYNRSIMPRPLSCPASVAERPGSDILCSLSQVQDGRWALDESSVSCMCCEAVFTALRRRHHCRWCGCLVCSSCSQAKRLLPPSDFGGIHAQYDREQSVCVVCRDVIDKEVQLVK